jgi:UDP-2,3-diacylglucosamine pyrophosphatase LpxH
MCPPRNQAALAALISSFARQHTQDVDVHLVLAGDIVDFLAETPYASFTAADEDARDKLDEIFRRTSEVWTALADLVERGCQLTLMLGNHDIELALPGPRKRLLERLGAGRVAFRSDGAPLRLGSTVVVHGNRDDTWNAVAYKRLDAFACGEIGDHAEIIVPGSELVAQVMNPIKQKHPWVDLLKPETSAVLPLLAVLSPGSVKLIPKVVQIYRRARARAAGGHPDDIGAAEPAELGEHVRLARELAGISDEIGAARDAIGAIGAVWRNATGAVRRAVRNRMRRALGAIAPADYFDTGREDPTWVASAEAVVREEGARTVVFGHTHLAKRRAIAGGTYLNTGTWADLLALPRETWIADPTDADEAAFDAFITDLVEDKLAERRRLVPTYVHIEHGDTDGAAELCLASGARLPDGDLLVLPR